MARRDGESIADVKKRTTCQRWQKEGKTVYGHWVGDPECPYKDKKATGKGKGKTSAALGMVVRAIGHGMKVGVVQFVKGAMQTGEARVFAAFPDNVEFKPMGEGFTWDAQDRQRDIAAARAAWQTACEMMADKSYDLIILDELNIVLRYDYLPLEEIVRTLQERRDGLHVVVTGRNAKDELIEAADLVTEMGEIKHHLKTGVKAQTGIEF